MATGLWMKEIKQKGLKVTSEKIDKQKKTAFENLVLDKRRKYLTYGEESTTEFKEVSDRILKDYFYSLCEGSDNSPVILRLLCSKTLIENPFNSVFYSLNPFELPFLKDSIVSDDTEWEEEAPDVEEINELETQLKEKEDELLWAEDDIENIKMNLKDPSQPLFDLLGSRTVANNEDLKIFKKKAKTIEREIEILNKKIEEKSIIQKTAAESVVPPPPEGEVKLPVSPGTVSTAGLPESVVTPPPQGELKLTQQLMRARGKLKKVAANPPRSNNESITQPDILNVEGSEGEEGSDSAANNALKKRLKSIRRMVNNEAHVFFNTLGSEGEESDLD